MPLKILSYLIEPQGTFPNNNSLPVLLYRQALTATAPEEIEQLLIRNSWHNPWRDSIYPYHHYHSNTHEVLAIYSGRCDVQLGGDTDHIITVEEGDVLIIPAGVSHKNIQATSDFKCIGAYPENIAYDMFYGDSNGLIVTEQKIKQTPLPLSDPLYGTDGVLFTYWKVNQ